MNDLAAEADIRKQATLVRGFAGYRWVESRSDPKIGKALAAAGVDRRLANLVSRRVPDGEDPLHWLDPRMVVARPDPFRLKDMDRAADIIAAEIMGLLSRGEARLPEGPFSSGAANAIGLFGDYDVDGAASTAIMARFFADLGVESHVRIPDRIEEGYGPNMPGLRELSDAGCGLIVILDTGALAFDVLAEAAREGLRIIVVDHHICEERLPEALAVVNPNRRDDTSGYGYMCAGGLALLTAIAVSAKLRGLGAFSNGVPMPDLKSYLDLAALATVADVALLRGVNRAIVASGLKVMRARRNEGLAALLEVSGTSDEIRPHHIGFQLGPRINAGGRIAEAWKGSLLLRSRDPAICRDLAVQLNDINEERRRIEEECRADAIAQVEERLASMESPSPESVDQALPCLAWALGDYHEGVIGIAAGRLKERFLRPAIVFSRTGDGFAKASGRSVEGFDIGAAVLKACTEGLLVKGGGHPMAAGLTVETDRIEAFTTFMDREILASDFARDGAPLLHDGTVPVGDVSLDFIAGFERLEPLGHGNPGPRFLVRGWTVAEADILKEVHLRFRFRAPDGSLWKGMIFSGKGSALGESLFSARDTARPLDMVVRFKINEWRGRKSIEVDVEDARFSDAVKA